MRIHKNSLKINDAMKKISTISVPVENNVDVFLFPIKSNEFDYDNAVEYLLESVADFALSRKTNDYLKQGGLMKRSKEARKKFKDWKINTGELGEFLLFCFLEGHLEAPKIFSKLELKTSSEMYVHGADGLHYLKLSNGNYQLIYGESKLYKNINAGLRNAFESISGFKYSINSKGNETSGISFERSLLSSNLERETFTEEEKEFLTSIIYPSQKKSTFEVDDAFGIFLGYEIDYEEEKKTLNNQDFRIKIENKVKDEIESQVENINKYINEFDLHGHMFYIFILPFSKIDDSRRKMLKELLS